MNRWTTTETLGCVAIAVLGSVLAIAGSAQTNRIAELGTAAQRLAEKNHFQGSLLIAEGNTTLVDTSSGYAERASHRFNTPDSQFRIGSLTKQFTACLVLLLQEDGRVRLNDRIGKYLPEAPAAWTAISIKNLLEQTSGIPDFTDDPRFNGWAATSHSHREEIDFLRNKPLRFRPGARFDYSNSNYILLGAVIEQATKQPYERELRRRILDPLQMSDSGIDADRLTLPRRAFGYQLLSGGLVLARSESMSIPWAAGGMYSTTHDLLKWLRNLFQGKLLSQPSLRAMTTPGKGGYGLGVCVGSKDGSRAIWHDGGIEGFNSYMVYLPDRRIAIIALANDDGDSSDSLSAQLLHLVLTD